MLTHETALMGFELFASLPRWPDLRFCVPCDQTALVRAQTNTLIKECFLEAGFCVLPAVPGPRATSHD